MDDTRTAAEKRNDALKAIIDRNNNLDHMKRAKLYVPEQPPITKEKRQ